MCSEQINVRCIEVKLTKTSYIGIIIQFMQDSGLFKVDCYGISVSRMTMDIFHLS